MKRCACCEKIIEVGDTFYESDDDILCEECGDDQLSLHDLTEGYIRGDEGWDGGMYLGMEYKKEVEGWNTNT